MNLTTWLAFTVAYTAMALTPGPVVVLIPGLFNAAGLAVLSPLRHVCGAEQGG